MFISYTVQGGFLGEGQDYQTDWMQFSDINGNGNDYK